MRYNSIIKLVKKTNLASVSGSHLVQLIPHWVALGFANQSCFLVLGLVLWTCLNPLIPLLKFGIIKKCDLGDYIA